MNEKIYAEPRGTDTQPVFFGRRCCGAILGGAFVTVMIGSILILLGEVYGFWSLAWS
ncbi:MAG TPA: hypothetical protein VKV04_05205 [Verrucomicrobiae bacterium]|nr:hypothetical protein [Verrucomicrobiae bacterium]